MQMSSYSMQFIYERLFASDKGEFVQLEIRIINHMVTQSPHNYSQRNEMKILKLESQEECSFIKKKYFFVPFSFYLNKICIQYDSFLQRNDMKFNQKKKRFYFLTSALRVEFACCLLTYIVHSSIVSYSFVAT